MRFESVTRRRTVVASLIGDRDEVERATIANDRDAAMLVEWSALPASELPEVHPQSARQ